MKTPKKNTVRNPFILLLLMVASCSGDYSYEEAMNKNKEKISEPGKLEDAAFLVEAKSVNLLEIELLELAAASGYSSAIVTLAKTNLEIHNAMSKDLKDIARQEDITLPNVMSSRHQSMLQQVADASREEFDQQVIDILKEINEDITSRFTVMATKANDPDIRAFSARKLDILRKHGEDVATVEKKLLTTSH